MTATALEAIPSIDFAALKLANPIEEVIGGFIPLTAQGREFLALCPFHSERTPSFTVVPDKGFSHCFGCGWNGDVIAFLCSYHNIQPHEAARMLGPGYMPRQARPLFPESREDDLSAKARQIWEKGMPAAGTLAETYLASRGIHLPIPPDIRFSTLSCDNLGALPCLIAAVRNVAGKVTGIQRIWLAPDGKCKAEIDKPKRSLGQIKGGAIRMGEPDGSGELVVCEGPEDGLTLHQKTGKPVWVAAGASFLPDMQIPVEVQSIVIGADNDPAGREAADKAARAFIDRGLRVRIVRPLEGFKDFNEEARDRGSISNFSQRLAEVEPFARFATNDADWPAPDMSILNAGRRAAVPMPTALFGPALPVLTDVAAGTATPLDYPAAGFLATCASLIGGKRRVRPYPTSNWSEPTILWIGIVGDPSSRKSPSLEAVIDPLRAIDAEGADQHKVALREWQEACIKAKAVKSDWEECLRKAIKEGKTSTPRMPLGAIEPEEPIRRRTLVMDATPEALGAILAGNPQGTLHYRDELAGWLQSFERYAPGGREFWLEAYGGRPFVIDRKGAKAPLTLRFNGVSVLGGIQPAKVADCLLSNPDDGLVARFLWVWPEKLPFARPFKCADIEVLERVYRRLERLQWGLGAEGQPVAITLPLSPAAADVFEAWQTENAETDSDASGLMKSFVGKLDGALLRLALTAELACWAMTGGKEPSEVSLEMLEAAAEWIDDYAKPMAERVYGDVALPTAERNAAVLARYIVKKGLDGINKRALKRSPHKSALPMLREAREMDAALEVLLAADWIRHSGTREDGRPGRATADYLINPLVHRGDK